MHGTQSVSATFALQAHVFSSWLLCSCGTDDQCCSSYEHCVSCCMTPGSGAQGQMQQVPKGLGKPETGHWEDIFSYCAAACRTTSRSTAHENAFIHERRFCFSEGGRPRVERSTAPPLPPSVLVVPGAFGKSCDVVCQEKHRSCSEAHFASLNDCDSLRRAFKCEAGCGPRSQQAGPFPAYVTDSAAKEEWPAYCFSGTLGGDGGEQGEQAQFSCSAAEEQFGRLCACQEVPQGANDVAEIDGEEGEADVAGQEESGDGAAETWEGDGGAEDLDEDEENEEGEEDESGEDIEPDEKRR